MHEFRANGVLLVRVTPGQPGNSLAAAIRDPRFRAGMPILVDRRHVAVPSADYVKRIQSWWQAHGSETGNSPLAILANTPAAYGMARMTEILLDDTGRAVRVFQDEREAEAWLLKLKGA